MNDDLYSTARELIREKRYAEARRVLEPIANQPKASEWMQRIDQVLAQQPSRTKSLLRDAPPLPPQNNDDVYGRAGELIKAKRYEEARRVLQPIAREPKARAWLAKIDEIAVDHLADFPSPPPVPVVVVKRKRTPAEEQKLFILIILVIILVGSFFYARHRVQEQREQVRQQICIEYPETC